MSDLPQLWVVEELLGADSGGGPGRFTIRNAVGRMPSRSDVLEWLEIDYEAGAECLSPMVALADLHPDDRVQAIATAKDVIDAALGLRGNGE